MKRSKKLIALLLVLVLLIGAVVAVQSGNSETDTDETEAADTGTVVYTLDADDVTALSWDYSEYVAFENGSDGWVYTEDEAFPLDKTYIETMLSALRQVTSYKTIENPADLDQYGLAVPVCAIHVTTNTVQTLKIGSESALGGQRYFSTGDGNVYLVDENLLSSFSYGLYDVLALETIPEMTEVSGFTVTTPERTLAITREEGSGKAYSDSYVWFADDVTLDTELTDALIARITGLAWNTCVDYAAEDLAAYGLAEPAASVTVEHAGGTFTLEIGSNTDDGCYVRLTDSNMVYLVDSTVHDSLCYATANELLPDVVLVMDWTQVTAVDLILDGETYTLGWAVKETTDADGNAVEETVLQFADTAVEATGITEALDAVTSVGYAAGLTSDQPAQIQILIHRNTEAYSLVELAFYPYDSSACLTVLNGQATVLADRTQVADLVELVNTLAK